MFSFKPHINQNRIVFNISRISFCNRPFTRFSSIDLLKRLQELHADSLTITNDDEIAQLSSRSLMMPKDIDEFLSPIPFILPAQLFLLTGSIASMMTIESIQRVSWRKNL